MPSLVCVDGMYGHPLPKSKLTSKTQDPWAYHCHLMWKRSPEPEELMMIEDQLSSSLPCDAFPSIEAPCFSNHLPFVPVISFSSSMGQALVAWGYWHMLNDDAGHCTKIKINETTGTSTHQLCAAWLSHDDLGLKLLLLATPSESFKLWINRWGRCAEWTYEMSQATKNVSSTCLFQVFQHTRPKRQGRHDGIYVIESFVI